MKNIFQKFLFSIDVFVLGIIILILVCGIIINFMSRGRIYDDVRDIPHNKVGVLLGISSHYPDGTHEYSFDPRVDAAADLYKAGKIDYILVSGGNYKKHGYSNIPVEMHDSLIKRGVPDDNIVLDYEGHRTIMTVEKLRDVYGLDSVTFISQPNHNVRAIAQARHYGIEAIGYNAELNPDLRQRLKFNAHEYLANVKMFWDFLFNDNYNFLQKPSSHYFE